MMNFTTLPHPLKNVDSLNYFPGLNAAKGGLIFLVILTHSIPHGMFLYFNYFFHMPVFLAISGFLLKASILKEGIAALFKRLLHRLIIPWILGLIGYLPFSLSGRDISEINLSDFIFPFFHLWYIPAYILGVLLCYAVIKYRISALFILVLTASITCGWFMVFKDNELPATEQPLHHLGDKRLYAYLFFFFIGFSLRNGLLKIKPSVPLLLFLIVFSLTATVILFYQDTPQVIMLIPYMVFNSCLALFVLIYVGPNEWFQHKLVLLINKHSLGLYLYHPMIIFLIYHFLGDENREHTNNWQGLAIGLTTLSIALTLILVLQKWSFANRCFLGIVNDQRNEMKAL